MPCRDECVSNIFSVTEGFGDTRAPMLTWGRRAHYTENPGQKVAKSRAKKWL